MNIHKIIHKIQAKLCALTKSVLRLRLVPAFLFDRPAPPLPVVYVVEDANWSIKWDGIHITRHLRALGRRARIETASLFQAGKILHYGSSYVFETQGFRKTGLKNRHVVTFFHGRYGEDPQLDKRFDLLRANIHRIDAVAYANSIMRERFLALGLPDEKLFYVPIGVDTGVFKPLEPSLRQARRQGLGIPEEAFVIGSFQKDGEGWDEGLEPKMIKGPDIFLQTLEALKIKRPIFCLLSGPARGYVKAGLERLGIAYIHEYYDDPDDVVGLYQLLDAYLVSSREEGGPKAILESLACGVPLVSTDVGMARDVMEGQNCGFVLPSEDVDGLALALAKIAQDPCLASEFSVNSLKRAEQYTWCKVAEACESLYRDIEARMG